MRKNDYFVYTGILFVIVAAGHALRIFLNWGIVIGGWAVPMWLSWVALIVTGYFVYTAIQLKK